MENVSSVQTYGPMALSLAESHSTRIVKYAVHRDRLRPLYDLKTAISAYIRNIPQADMQKVFANKIKRVQACINARGHHFQRIL
jgi:uncharacterized protein YifN (PemK superfamily)